MNVLAVLKYIKNIYVTGLYEKLMGIVNLFLHQINIVLKLREGIKDGLTCSSIFSQKYN